MKGKKSEGEVKMDEKKRKKKKGRRWSDKERERKLRESCPNHS